MKTTPILTAEHIRRVRRMFGDSQLDFAKRLEVGAVTVARWETGQRACKGAYANRIMELDKQLKLSMNTCDGETVIKQPLKKTDDHGFPDNALVFKLGCIKCGGRNVHPQLCHLQEDNDEYEGAVYGYSGRGDYMVVALYCESCDDDAGQLVLSNHKGDGFLAIYPKTRIYPKPKPLQLKELGI